MSINEHRIDQKTWDGMNTEKKREYEPKMAKMPRPCITHKVNNLIVRLDDVSSQGYSSLLEKSYYELTVVALAIDQTKVNSDMVKPEFIQIYQEKRKLDGRDNIGEFEIRLDNLPDYLKTTLMIEVFYIKNLSGKCFI